MTSNKFFIILFFTLSASVSNAQLYFCIFDHPEMETATAVLASDEFVNDFGDLVNTSKGYHAENEISSEADLVKRSYYQNDLLVAQRNYTIDGDLTSDDAGISIYEYDYDENGNLLKVQYFDENREATQAAFAGPAMIQYEYDATGNKTKATYFDKYYNLLDLGISTVEYIYNNNHLVMEKRYNSKNELVSETAPIIQYHYNNEGQITQQSFLDANNQKASRLMGDDDYDIAKIAYEYEGNKITMTYYYNIKGELLGSEKKSR
jgi:YD repeat-containing protein